MEEVAKLVASSKNTSTQDRPFQTTVTHRVKF